MKMIKFLGAFLVTIFMAAPAMATILDFNISGIASDYRFGQTSDPVVFPRYGSYVEAAGVRAGDWFLDDGNGWLQLDSTYAVGAEGATPNVISNFFTITNRYWGGGYGDLTDVAWYTGGSDSWFFSLTPDPGYQVTIESFDLAYFGPSGDTVVEIFEYDRPGNTWTTVWQYDSGNSVTIAGTDGGHTSFSPGYTGTDSSKEYWIHSTPPGGNADFYAIDNIVISQSLIPEPSTLTLAFVVVMGGLFTQRQRRR